jgi:hypothetical protein
MWRVVSFLMLFLIATNSLTNPFVHNLHNDALAQLISIIAYWLLLEYISKRKSRILFVMAIIPSIGFLTKQSLTIWAILYCIHLALFDRPRSLIRFVSFGLGAIGGILMVIVACYVHWGDHFIYWAFGALGKHGVSPLRGCQHALDVWPYLALGLLAGPILLSGKGQDLLIGPWVIWLMLFVAETYTSGIAWMKNHVGPGSLIAGVWFIAGMVRLWPFLTSPQHERNQFTTWLRAGIFVVVTCLILNGLGIIRIPAKPLSDDVHRYVHEIEKEFSNQSVEDVLLDAGTWVYFKDGVIMKDRAPSIGERGYSETGDFSGVLGRIEQKRYSKILVRNLHSPDFMYDYWLWRKSSGIRQALLDNYKEIRQIKAVARENYQYNTFLFSEISVLVPKMN